MRSWVQLGASYTNDTGIMRIRAFRGLDIFSNQGNWIVHDHRLNHTPDTSFLAWTSEIGEIRISKKAPTVIETVIWIFHFWREKRSTIFELA
jgi:hypothetical protein